MAKKLLRSWIGAHTRVHMHFLQRVGMHLQELLRTMHVQVCTLDRCCELQRTHLLHALYRMCTCDRCRYIYIYIWIGICIHIYVYVHVCAYVYVYVSMYVCMCMCMYMFTDIRVCMYVCVCVHAYVYMCMYIYKSIYMSAESLHAFTGVVAHHACAGVYVRQMLWTSAYTFASPSLQDVHMRYTYTRIYAYMNV